MNTISETLLLQVEVNLLTGETLISRTDIIYDCGQSLNPAVDLGQVSLALIIHATIFQETSVPFLTLLKSIFEIEVTRL